MLMCAAAPSNSTSGSIRQKRGTLPERTGVWICGDCHVGNLWPGCGSRRTRCHPDPRSGPDRHRKSGARYYPPGAVAGDSLAGLRSSRCDDGAHSGAGHRRLPGGAAPGFRRYRRCAEIGPACHEAIDSAVLEATRQRAPESPKAPTIPVGWVFWGAFEIRAGRYRGVIPDAAARSSGDLVEVPKRRRCCG